MGYKSDVLKATRVAEAVDFPTVVLLDNINACNLACSMCDHPNVKKYRIIQRMDMKLYKKLIDEIAIENPNARVWQIFFGDPFICPDMPERIQYAKDKGLTDVVLNTNGVLMTKKKSRDYIKAGLDAIYVGIDASTEKTYDQIRVKGDFNLTVKNTLRYRDLLEKYGKNGQELYVQLVESDINEYEVDDFKTFWTNEGIGVKIRPKVSWAGLIDAENLWDNREVERKPCYWAMNTMAICAHGQVALCAVDIHGRVDAGDSNTHTLKELWQDKLKDYRAMHLEGRFDELPSMCQNCSDWQSGYAEFS